MHNITFATFPYAAFTDLTPYQYGREECESGHAFGPARRSHYLFHLILSGKGTLVADDENGNPVRYKLEGGQGFMLFPGQVTTYAADIDDPWRYTWIEFDGLRVKSALDAIGLSPSSPIYSS
ncbi:MAG: AraC family ligand binding domain-containing protein, partial [Olsenella sp.]